MYSMYSVLKVFGPGSIKDKFIRVKLTRFQLNALDIPLVGLAADITANNVISDGSLDPKDPWNLHTRPPKATVTKVNQIFKASTPAASGFTTTAKDQLEEADCSSVKIEIPTYGCFNAVGLSLLEDFVAINKIKQDVEFKLNWLSDLKSSDPQRYDLLKSFLFHKTENFEIAAFDLCGIDVGSFSTLVGECYIDSFIMNFLIKKYLSLMLDDRKKCFIYLETDLFKNSLKMINPL